MSRKLAIAYFVHSVRSDWNNGNAHFQRGLARALAEQGHFVICFEEQNSWSSQNQRMEKNGAGAFARFSQVYSDIVVKFFVPDRWLLREQLRDIDIVIIHEWNSPELVHTVLSLREELGFRMLFHDTHHRASSTPEQIAAMRVAQFDGVLAFGEALRQIYRARFCIDRVWTFHEAADTSIFFPRAGTRTADIVWVGNWGDDERSEEICSYLVRPACRLPQFRFAVYGVRYPDSGLTVLRQSGIQFHGYLPNLGAPDIYNAARLTMHIPRQQYREAMTGIPTIRVFEALAAGIPLISAPWEDTEHLFCPGDYVLVRDEDEMVAAMEHLLANPSVAEEMAGRGLQTVLSRHTCRHRAQQLTAICEEILSA